MRREGWVVSGSCKGGAIRDELVTLRNQNQTLKSM